MNLNTIANLYSSGRKINTFFSPAIKKKYILRIASFNSIIYVRFKLKLIFENFKIQHLGLKHGNF